MRGCLAWQRDGLAVPQAVERATGAYREAMDPLGDFLRDCCHVGELWTVGKAELRGAYETWCKVNGHKPLSGQAFPAALAEHAVRDGWEGKARVWRGVGLREEASNTTPTP